MVAQSSPALWTAVREVRLGAIPKAPKAPKSLNALRKKKAEKSAAEYKAGSRFYQS
jgi:hypothetical protein